MLFRSIILSFPASSKPDESIRSEISFTEGEFVLKKEEGMVTSTPKPQGLFHCISQWLKTKNQITNNKFLLIFIVVAIPKGKRPDCLFFFFSFVTSKKKIRTKKFGISNLVFMYWLMQRNKPPQVNGLAMNQNVENEKENSSIHTYLEESSAYDAESDR